MPSLKEIKTRIASVNNTRKITSAMKMVASSKLHHAQTAIQNMLPYENLLEHILKSFLITVPEVQNKFQAEREVRNVMLPLMTWYSLRHQSTPVTWVNKRTFPSLAKAGDTKSSASLAGTGKILSALTP